MKAERTIVFEDDGQDFLEWDIDKGGTVVDCRPFQWRLWKGTRIREICVGQYPRITLKRKVHGTRQAVLSHRVEAIKAAA